VRRCRVNSVFLSSLGEGETSGRKSRMFNSCELFVAFDIYISSVRAANAILRFET
jgi:hypothetical protein